MQLLRDVFDGVLRSRIFGNKAGDLRRETSQPLRSAILNDNAELRKNPGVLRKLDAMEWTLQIPEDDFGMLLKCNPALKHDDAEIRLAAWKAFIASPESMPYRVRDQSWRKR